eukprot:scaffold181427_cov20-Tisochrysis_lutea.AAC.1
MHFHTPEHPQNLLSLPRTILPSTASSSNFSFIFDHTRLLCFLQLALHSQLRHSSLRTMAVSANDPESIKRKKNCKDGGGNGLVAHSEILELLRTGDTDSAFNSLLVLPKLRLGSHKSSIINNLKASAARARLLDGQNAYHKKAKTGPLPGVTRALGSFQVSRSYTQWGSTHIWVTRTLGSTHIEITLANMQIGVTRGLGELSGERVTRTWGSTRIGVTLGSTPIGVLRALESFQLSGRRVFTGYNENMPDTKHGVKDCKRV